MGRRATKEMACRAEWTGLIVSSVSSVPREPPAHEEESEVDVDDVPSVVHQDVLVVPVLELQHVAEDAVRGLRSRAALRGATCVAWQRAGGPRTARRCGREG